MTLKISSIKTNEIIAPGSTVCWSTDANCYAIVEARGTVDLEWRKSRERLYRGDIAIGRKFRIHNRETDIVSIRGILFYSAPFPEEDDRPITMNVHNESSAEWQIAIAQLLDSPLCLEKLKEGESIFYTLHQSFRNMKEQSYLSVKQRPVGKIDRRLIVVNRYIRDHFMEPLTLQILAYQISCNPVYLSNTYSKIFGISPIKYLQKLKMAKACEWLVQTDWSIREISNKLGYVSNSQFAGLFKRYHGISPVEFRRSENTQYFY